jgi:hypothetical protein
MNGCLKYVLIYVLFLGGIAWLINFTNHRASFNYHNELIAESIVLHLKSKDLGNIAVANFEPIGKNYPGVGEYFADKISGEIRKKSDEIKIIDRSKLNTLLEELDLLATGILSKQSAIEKGKLLGINAVITGRYKLIDNWIRSDKLYVSYKVIDLEAGEMIYADEVSSQIFPELEIIHSD